MTQIDDLDITDLTSQVWWPLVEPTPRWVRVRLGGELVASSRNALLLIDYGPHRLPTYFIPRQDVSISALSDPVVHDDGRTTWTVCAGGRRVEGGAYSYDVAEGELAALAGYVSFVWEGLDWFEEEEALFAHARDPHKRVDVAPSSRHVRVEIDGLTVAESARPTLLFETTLPVRYYLPAEDVRTDLLVPSKTVSQCPYKGTASYFSLPTPDRLRKDVAWTYRTTVPENPRIRDLICFFNERVELIVDGEPLPRPITPWS